VLAKALFYVALTGVVTATFLSAGLAMTRASIHRLAQTYVASGYQRAASTLQQTLAEDLRAGGLPSPLPSFTPLPETCVDSSNPCRYENTASIALTQSSVPAASAQCDSNQTNCASNEQANAYVQESRITARITVTIAAAADGTVLAQRTGDVIVRTMKTPPYAVIAGSRDGTFDDVVGRHAVGDDGGALPATPNPCSSPLPAGISDDTAVRVAYRNQTTNACTDGSAWRTESYSTDSGSAWSP
jgi:hypothetical protein